MGRHWMTGGVALAFAAGVATGPAHADIFTWVDKDGITHVSNVQPPEGTRVTSVARTAPRDAAREAAARDAARLAEVRALQDRVDALGKEVELSRSIPPPYAAPPMMAMAPAAPAPTVIVTVINQPAQPEVAPAACDLAFNGCGLGFFPGYTYYAPMPYQRGFHRPHRKWATPMPARQGGLIPPLIPYPTTHPSGGRRLG